MKKLVSLLLILMVILTGTAAAETVSAAITLNVLREDGSLFSGANVTVYNELEEIVMQAVVGEEPIVLDALAEGTYTVYAVDPADGYANIETFYADVDQGIELVIRKLQAGSKVTVGSVTRLSGAFFTDLWGTNTSDMDARALLHGLNTIAWTSDRKYAFDKQVVAQVKAQTESNGDKTYIFTLNDGLKYSDGSGITAEDYVFSVLLQSAPQMQELGVSALTYAHLDGQSRYLSGRDEAFRGVRLLSENSFSLTIDEDYLPYFYELTYVNVTPYPIEVIAPGCEVRDDGEGAYIAGDFTAALLEETILDPQSGYLTNPTVTSGAYKLTGYDAQAGTATFIVNPYYPGNYQGIKPVIESLEIREAKYANALEQLDSGTIDVLNKATDGSFIDSGVAKFNAGELGAASYLRSGYGFLAFACEESATESVDVRKAMAMCLDRDAMIEDFLGSYGLPVYSHYGLGQWMAQPYIATMQEEVTVYPYDLAKAVELLKEDGWKYNAEGKRFVEGEDTVRYKKEDGELIPLEIRFAQVKDNAAAAWIVENYAPVLESIGFDFVATEVTFDEMLKHYYRQSERTYNLMCLATNFNVIYDPYFTFNTDEAYQGTLNTSGIEDKRLMNYALELRQTEPDNEEGYSEKWLDLMERFSDVLPTLPIYSNVYYDFYTNDLMNYAPNAHWSWTSAIMYAYLTE